MPSPPNPIGNFSILTILLTSAEILASAFSVPPLQSTGSWVYMPCRAGILLPSQDSSKLEACRIAAGALAMADALKRSPTSGNGNTWKKASAGLGCLKTEPRKPGPA